MLRLTAERRSLPRESGAPTGPEPTYTEDLDVFDCSTETAPRRYVPRKTSARSPRTTTLSDIAAWALFAALCLAMILAFCAASWVLS